MEKIKRISSIAIVSINILIAVYFVFLTSIWSSLATDAFFALPNLMGRFVHTTSINGFSWDQLNAISWSFGSWSLGLLTTLICALPTFIGLWILRGIFKNYSEGNIFSSANASSFRVIGILFFVDALVAIPLKDTLMTLATTMNNPPGERMISLSVGTTNLEALFTGLVIIVISLVMSEGSKLQTEQELVI